MATSREDQMLTRRAALMGVAGIAAAPYVIKTAGAETVTGTVAATPVDLSSLPRRKVELVTPPFVHAHEQVATTGPEIVKFALMIVAKEPQLSEGTWHSLLAA